MKKNYTLLLLLFTILANGQTPTELWSFTLPKIVKDSSPTIGDDGTIYIGCEGKEGVASVFAINSDGTEKWKYETGNIVRSTPAINVNGFIYINSYDKLYAFNPASGAIELQFDTGNILKNSPVFATDGTTYIGSETGELIAVNLDETEKWRYDIKASINGTPAIGSDGTIYTGSALGTFFALNPEGTLKWQSEFGTTAATTTAIGPDGTVYFAGEGNNLDTRSGGVLIAYNSTDGVEKWRVALTSGIRQGGPSVAADGTVYAGGKENKLVAYNSLDGTPVWSYNTNGNIQGTPAIDNDGNIYVTDNVGYLYILDSAGNEAYTPLQLGVKIWSSTTIGSDGRIYVVADKSNGTSKLFALTTTATGLQVGGWPMRSKDAKHSGNVNPIKGTLSVNSHNTIKGFIMYPNPVDRHNGFYIETSSNQQKSIQFFDMLGRQVYTKEIGANEKIETSNLRTGIYTLKVVENNKLATVKLIIK